MGMEMVLQVALVITAITLCKHSQADWNVTKDVANRSVSCGRHGNSSACPDAPENTKWSGQFSKCPKEFQHYCIHGKCRFVKDQNTPSCWCKSGYIGARCEYLDFDLHTGERKEIIVACVIAGLVFLLFLILFICICAHRRKLSKKRKKEEEKNKKEETEKLSMVGAASGHRAAVVGSAEPLETDAV